MLRKMWPKLRPSLATESGLGSFPGEGAPSERQQRPKHVSSSIPSSINVNEEYRKTLRTKSYIDVWTKIHRHLRRSATHPSSTSPPQPPSPSCSAQEEDLSSTASTTPLTLTPSRSTLSTTSSPFFSYSHLPDYLLEPHNVQEALLGTVHDPDLHALFVDFFDASREACNICSSLLGCIDLLRRSHHNIQRLLNQTTAAAAVTTIDSADLATYVEHQNPLSPLKTVQFHRIHDLYDSLIRRLMLARDNITRRVRLVRLVRRVSGVMLVAVCGVLATAVLVVAAHTVVVLAVAGGPVLVGPFSAWMRRRVAGPVRTRRLVRMGAQVDAAARGAYIMNRDMETISRMVTRLHDEVEHGKDVVRLFLRSGERWVLREVVERGGGGGGGGGFGEQLDELEEHVYWCLLMINRTRGLVAQEITAGTWPPPTPTTATFV